MIYSIITITCNEFLTPHQDDLSALYNFVARASLASSVVLRLQGTREVFIEGKEKSSHLASMLAQVLQLAPCHIDGIPCPGLAFDAQVIELFAVTMLDAGALSVVFDIGAAESAAEVKSFLALFPRTRSGIRVVSDVDENRILSVFSDFRDVASTMTFRFTRYTFHYQNYK